MRKEERKKMNKKKGNLGKIVGILIIGVFILGLVSAGLVSYLSNQISVDFSVSGPRFYLESYDVVGSGDNGLVLNEFSGDEDEAKFLGADNVLFVSNELGVEDFYAANFKVILDAESNSSEGQVDINLWLIGGSVNNKKEHLCWEKQIIDNRDEYVFDCSVEELELDEEDRFMLEVSDGANEIEYIVYLNGDSLIEVEDE